MLCVLASPAEDWLSLLELAFKCESQEMRGEGGVVARGNKDRKSIRMCVSSVFVPRPLSWSLGTKLHYSPVTLKTSGENGEE